MKIDVTRRDVLRFAGGTAIGAALTPAPWKLLDDLAIWTQNWKWIPKTPEGPVTQRATICSLCPQGCGVSARCVGGQPVSLHAAAGDPRGARALCPLGMTGHHLPFHPARVTRATRILRDDEGERALPVQLDSVIAESAAAMKRGAVAVLDLRPERSLSWGWQRFAVATSGSYIPLRPERRIAFGDEPFGVDLENAATIISFGAPLAEGWGTPKITTRLLSRDAAPRLIQIEPLRSATAEVADRWLPVRPGAEALVALAMANVLLGEGLVEVKTAKTIADFDAFVSFVRPLTPDAVAERAGISAGEIVALAHEAANGAIVVSADLGPAVPAIDALNILLGNAGRPGGLVARNELPAPFDSEIPATARELAQVADRSIALLLIDGSAGDAAIPWPSIERKLASKSVVVALSPFRAGTAAHADFIAPTLPYLESLQELPTPFDAPAATFALSTPLMTPRAPAVDPAAFLRTLAAKSRTALPDGWSNSEELVRARVARIHAAGRGSVANLADGSTTAMTAIASPDDLWTALTDGSRWTDDARPSMPEKKYDLLRGVDRTDPAPPTFELTLLVRGSRDVTASAVMSPVMTKLYQESALRRAADVAVVNPATARRFDLRDGGRATLETNTSRMTVTIATDQAVMPGVVVVNAAPDCRALGMSKARTTRGALDLCSDDSGGSLTAARLVEG